MMSKACRNRITAWGMMGLLVVGLNVWSALPARAVPIDYTLAGPSVVGEITTDNTLVNPYVAWSISSAGSSWNNLSDAGILANNFSSPGVIQLDTVNHAGLEMKLFSSNTGSGINATYDLTVFDALRFPPVQILGVGGVGLLIRSSSNVPEPPPGLLFPIGLLVLAGARWWTHRQERLPLG
jgi:hypothetical protein